MAYIVAGVCIVICIVIIIFGLQVLKDIRKMKTKKTMTMMSPDPTTINNLVIGPITNFNNFRHFKYTFSQNCPRLSVGFQKE